MPLEGEEKLELEFFVAHHNVNVVLVPTLLRVML